MGLYILPARLKRQLSEIQDILLNKTPYDKEALENPEHSLYVHRFMIAELVEKHGIMKDEKKASDAVTAYVNNVCVKILNNTAVFKQDAKGMKALREFLATINVK
jgi:UDPglucose--hexose-1-phosphate uridylyltransferase